MNTVLRRLSPADVTLYRQLRLKGLRESPTAFGSSFDEESAMPVDVFSKRLEQNDDKWVFGAFRGKRLVGVVTLLRDAQLKSRHKAGIFGMYVEDGSRRIGIGRALLGLALDTASRLSGLRQVRLCVESSNCAALKLYQAFGFSEYGRECDALFIDGRFYDELLLVRKLERRRPKKSATDNSGASSHRV